MFLLSIGALSKVNYSIQLRVMKVILIIVIIGKKIVINIVLKSEMS